METKQPNRKVFISFLGASNYGECHYYIDDYVSKKIRYIQEATIEYLVQKKGFDENSVAYILLTDKAKKQNWEAFDFKKPCSDELFHSEGLKVRLDAMHLPFNYESIDSLPDGNNEQEIWEIFQRIYEKLEDNDELYFDLTHGYRYLPMLVLVLGSYARFLKNITVKHVSYGNFEGRDLTTNHALIVDLMPLITLQNWSYAAGQFFDNGSVTELHKIAKEKSVNLIKQNKEKSEDAQLLNGFTDKLKAFVLERSFCRGKDIIDARVIRELKQKEQQLSKNVIPVFEPIINKFSEVLEKENDTASTLNALSAARWCFDHHLYQQSATILEEFFISYFCEKYDLEIGEGKNRELIGSKIFANQEKKDFDSAFSNYLERNKIDEDASNILRSKFKCIWSDEILSDADVIAKFQSLRDLRNTYNHSGMNYTNIKTAQGIQNDLASLLGYFEDLFSKTNIEQNPVGFPPLFINLSNHPSSTWDEKQLAAAREYGVVVDVPFPAVSAEATTEELEAIAQDLLEQVGVITKKNTDSTIHVMGEMNLTYILVGRLQHLGYRCVASTTVRNAVDNPDGTKTSKFQFVQFREYGE